MVKNPPNIHEGLGSILVFLSGLRIQCCYELCGVGCRHGLDHMLLWLWLRPSATAPIQPLAWDLPYAESEALKEQKKKKKKKVRLYVEGRADQIVDVLDTEDLVKSPDE